MNEFTGNFRTVKSVQQDEAAIRATFLRNTYLHVALSVLLFMLVEAIFLSTPAIVNIGLKMTQGWTWLIVLGGFMFVTNKADNWARNSTEKSKQYLALLLYVIAEAFIFVPLIYMALSITGDSTLVTKAGIMTAFLFTGLTAFALFSGANFSFLKGFLTVGFFIALGLIVLSIVFGFNLGTIFSAAMILLAGGTILYQTSTILNHYNKDQYVAASLGLFASFMLLFWYILSILMRLND